MWPTELVSRADKEVTAERLKWVQCLLEEEAPAHQEGDEEHSGPHPRRGEPLG